MTEDLQTNTDKLKKLEKQKEKQQKSEGGGRSGEHGFLLAAATQKIHNKTVDREGEEKEQKK